MKNLTLVCSNCGSTHVLQKAWIDVNTKKIDDDVIYDAEDTYCPDCLQSAGVEHLTKYTNDCYEGLKHSCSTEGGYISKMLGSVLPCNVSPCDPDMLRNMLERLSDDQIRDMSLRIKFLQTLRLALEQHLDLTNNTPPTEMSCSIRGQKMKYIYFKQNSLYDGLSRMIPNRRYEYKSIEQFIEDVLDLNKENLLTGLEALGADEMPF